MLRYLNMFVLIGIALIIISLIGFVTGNQFLAQPGEKAHSTDSLLYLGAGVLMLINGLVSIRNAPPQPVKPSKGPDADADKSEPDARELKTTI